MKKGAVPMRSSSRSLVLIVATVGFAIVASSEVSWAAWILLGRTENGDLYYNGEEIQHSASGIVTVWTKMVYTEKGVKAMVAQRGPGFDGLDHSVHLSEIDCVGKLALSLSTVYFAKKGKVLKTEEPTNRWEFIPPESNRDTLSQKVCSK